MEGARDLFHLVGAVLDDKYRVDAVLGEGGFGVVYAGTHLYLGQPIAIKCMKPLAGTSDEEERLVSLFLREAKVLFTLTHPGIVRFYDIGVVHRDGRQIPYAVLELIQGRPLAYELAERARERRPLSAGEIRDIVEPALEALSFAHRSGVAHRDIKPANILLVDGGDGSRVKLVDFGVARWLRDPVAASGHTGITPAYAAPEQWDASLGAAGPASDVFAMALVIEELCTLRSRYAELPPTQILADLMRGGARPELRRARPDLPEALERVLERAMQLRPGDRHANAGELLADLREALRGVTPARASAAGAGASLDWSAPSPGQVETGTPVARTRGRGRAAQARWTLPVGIAAGVLCAGGALLALRPLLGARAQPGAGPAAGEATAVDSVPAQPAQPEPPPDPHAGVGVFVTATAPGADLPAGPAAKVAEEHAEGLLRCYRSAFAGRPGPPGEVTVLVSVATDGSVFAVQDMDEGMSGPEVLQEAQVRVCLGDEIKSWRYPQHKKEDVAGVLYTFRYQRGLLSPEAAQAGAANDAIAGAYSSIFYIKDPYEPYPPYHAVLEQRGDRVIGNYTHGTMACNRRGDKLTCRWCQTDERGRASLVVKKGGLLDGVWGYEPSDSNGGGWKLVPKKK